MIDGYAPIRNLIGIGDPNVHLIDGKWTMFIGGFQTNFKNNIFSVHLDEDKGLDDTGRWNIDTQTKKHHKAKPLVPQPAKGEWDAYGLHEPCYVEGADVDGRILRRVYYTGRATAKVHDAGSVFAIGFLEFKDDSWQRGVGPVITGDKQNPSVLGPKVIYDKGVWKIWYRATPLEPVKGIYPVSSIYYAESKDGITWSKPSVFFDASHEVSHAYVHKVGEVYLMLTSTSPNIFHETPYPPQKLWLRTATHPSGNANDWSDPIELMDANDGEQWYGDGFFGSSLVAGEDGKLHIFFAGVNKPVNWFGDALKRLLKLKLPPFPAPYFFTIGEAVVDMNDVLEITQSSP